MYSIIDPFIYEILSFARVFILRVRIYFRLHFEIGTIDAEKISKNVLQLQSATPCCVGVCEHTIPGVSESP